MCSWRYTGCNNLDFRSCDLKGEDKDRYLQCWLGLLGDNVNPIDIEGHQGFTKVRHKMLVLLSGSNYAVLTGFLYYLLA